MIYSWRDTVAVKPTLESRITYRVRRSKANVFMRRDFEDLGGYDQVGRVLRQLVKKEVLFSIGYGLYARSKRSSLTGKLRPNGPLPWLAKEALNKLGIESVPTDADIAYNEGRSTQVPTGRAIGVKGRISRKINYDGKSIYFERYS